jgi:hypothetical protein
MFLRFAHLHFRFFALLKQAWQGYKTKMPAKVGHSFGLAEREGNERKSTHLLINYLKDANCPTL